MSNRKIINAAATGGIGYYPVVGASDPYYDKVSLLLNGDTDVDTNFANVSLLLTGNDLLDKSNNKATVTANGNATVTSVKKQFGTGSYYFDGSGDYLSIPASTNFSFGTGDVTIEAWIWWESATYIATGRLICGNNGSGSTDQFGIFEGIGLSCFGISNNVAANYPPVQQWVHVACSKQGSTVRLFINGVMTASGTQTAAVGNSTYPMLIGTRANDTQWYHWWNGYIDDFRITKGIARYTANFTPPTQALPSHEILDSSVYRLPVTTYGNARIDTATKKYGTGAMYFDGAGDYLTLPINSQLLLDGDFTIEAWAQLPSSSAKTYYILCGFLTPNNYLAVNKVDATNYKLEYYDGTNDIYSTTTFGLNAFTHLAIVKKAGIVTLYVNGIGSSATNTGSTTWGSSTTSLYVGTSLAYSGSWEWSGYIDDLRITKGFARYTANFTPPTAALPTIPPTIAADPWWGNVSLLLDGNTTDAYDPYWQNVSLMLTGDDFIDWSNQHGTVTNNNGAVLDTTNKKFNSSSYYFSGTNQFLSVPSSANTAFGTANFTLELWYRPTALPASAVNSLIFTNATTWAANTFVLIDRGSAAPTKFAISCYNIGGAGSNLTGTTSVVNGNWYHIAIVRNGTTLSLYVNGNLDGSITTSASIDSGTSMPFYIGGNATTNYDWHINGNIADIRITKGVARTITAPTAALPAFKIQDRTQNNLTLTPYGNVQLSTDVKKNGTGSIYFDGTGDYLSIANSANFKFGTGDFTIEFWGNFSNQDGAITSGGTGSANIQIRIGAMELQFESISFSATASMAGLYNSWHHYAYARSSGVTKLFIDGTLANTVTESNNYQGSETTFNIGWRASAYFYVNGYIDDLRITKGYARYTQNFTPPSQSFATQYISTGFDPNYADVSLLLTGEGTNGSTTFTDLSSSPKTITNNGSGIKISTGTKKYGTGSLQFLGSSYTSLTTQASTAFAFGTDNFTVEFWINTSDVSGYKGTVNDNSYHTTTSNFLLMLNYPTSGKLTFWKGDIVVCATASNISTGNWIHVAFVRDSVTSVKIYINGVLDTSGTIANTTTFGTGNGLIIGNQNGFDDARQLIGYMDDIRITKGIARYTTNFTPPTYALATTTGTPFDVNRSSTSLLLRGNGTNGSTSFTDESPNNLTVTNTGSVTVNTTTKKYGTGSMAFSGSGQYLTIPAALSLSGDFTIEFWVNPSSLSGANPMIVGSGATSWGSGACGICVESSSSTIKLFTYASTGNAIVATPALSTGNWYHVALARSGSTVKMYLNGVSSSSATNTETLFSPTNLYIGFNGWDSPTGNQFNGYLDDLRITKGYARYTANFTPPTYEDPIITGTQYDYNYAQVSLLLNGDGTNGSQVFTDLSSSPKTITAYGNAQISTGTKKFGTGAMYFDGTGDYMTIPASQDWVLGTTDFTIEMWIKTPSPYSNFRYGPIGQTDTFNGRWMIRPRTGEGQLGWAHTMNGSTYADISSGLTLPNDTWCHIAVVRQSGVFKFFLDGVKGTDNSSYTTDSLGSISYPLYIGRNVWDGNLDFPGYIDDLRITKGLARYTQNFTPPTAPLPTSYS
jgi:hypothetical protein